MKLVKKTDKPHMQLKHRVVWEQHYGKIPKGYNVQFKDGNRHNFDINNLYLISRAEQLNTENSIRVLYPEELVEVIQLKGALKRKINKLKNI